MNSLTARIRYQDEIKQFNYGGKSLVEAILLDVLLVLDQTEKERRRSRQQMRRDWEWLHSDDEEHIFSFINCCHYLRLNPSHTRRLIQLGINPVRVEEYRDGRIRRTAA